MAKLKRSVWEVRFYALLETLRQEASWLESRVSHKALSDTGLSSEDRTIARAENEQIERLLKLARQIETQPAQYMFLERD